jgi:GxxExxY protein
MVCSICGVSGHNKATCSKNDVKTKPNVSESAIPLGEDVCEKLSVIEEISKKVINILGMGHVEDVYQQAIGVELQKRNIQHSIGETVPIMYDGVIIGYHPPCSNIILRNYLPIIIELNTKNDVLTDLDFWQLMRYMNVKQYPYGVMITPVSCEFIVKYNDAFYMYNNVTKSVKKMKDYFYTDL